MNACTAPEEIDLPVYEYESLIAPDAVRILVLKPSDTFTSPLRCSITQYRRSVELSQTDVPRHYTAISYTWGEANFSRRLLCTDMNGCTLSLPISVQVDKLLRYLRKPYKLIYLWLDAISLNQNDKEEKEKQILLMGEIHKMAKKVRVWLGEDESESYGNAFSILRSHALGVGGDHLRPADRADLVGLFQNPWFLRRWVIQEVALAQRAIFHSGRHSLDLSLMLQGLETIQKVTIFDSSLYGLSMLLAVRGEKIPGNGMPHLLWKLHKSECSDQRDRLAALCGLLPPGGQLELNYYREPWTTIYHQYATHFVNDNPVTAKMLILHLFDFGQVNQKNFYPECPSWVPNWSNPRQQRLPYLESSFKSMERKLGSAWDRYEVCDDRLMMADITTNSRSQAKVDPDIKESPFWEDAEKLMGQTSTALWAESNVLYIQWHPRFAGLFGKTPDQIVKLYGSQTQWQDVLESLLPLRCDLDSKYNALRLSTVLATALRWQKTRLHSLSQDAESICRAIQSGLQDSANLLADQIQILEEIGQVLADFALLRFPCRDLRVYLQKDPTLPERDRVEYGLGPYDMEKTDVLIPLFEEYSFRDEAPPDLTISSDSSTQRPLSRDDGPIKEICGPVSHTMISLRPIPEIHPSGVEQKPCESETSGPSSISSSQTHIREARMLGPAYCVTQYTYTEANLPGSVIRDLQIPSTKYIQVVTPKEYKEDYVKARKKGLVPLRIDVL